MCNLCGPSNFVCLCFTGQEEDGRKVLVLSYPQYCRFRSVLARLREQPSSLLIDHTVLALGGIAALGGSTRILYCRDTFEHPALLQNESICDEFGEFGRFDCSFSHWLICRAITVAVYGVWSVERWAQETSNSSCPVLWMQACTRSSFPQHGSSLTFNYVILVTMTICSSLLLVGSGQCLLCLRQAIQLHCVKSQQMSLCPFKIVIRVVAGYQNEDCQRAEKRELL